MMSAQQITKALGGRWHGGYGLARCPAHDDRTPSLSIRDGDVAALFKCFAGCDRQDVANELRRRGLIGGCKPTAARRRVPPKRPTEPEPDDCALAMWLDTISLDGTPAEIYLRETRSIRLPYPPSIRFHSGKCAMVAAINRPTDRKIVSVQLTYLTPGGEKASLPDLPKSRLTFGTMGTGAVRLAPYENLLGLAEGTETALSAMEITGVPCWAALGRGRLACISLPDSVRVVHLFADRDASKAGQNAAKDAAKAYTSQGRKVVTRYAPIGNDWNDFAQFKRGATDL